MFDVSIKLSNQSWEKAQLSIDEHRLTLRRGAQVTFVSRQSIQCFRVLKKNRIGLFEENKAQAELEIEYPNIKGLLLSYWPGLAEKRSGLSILNLRLLTILGIMVVGLLFLSIFLFWGVFPLIKREMVKNFPREQEIDMGKKLYSQLIQQEKPDTIASRYLNEFAKELNFYTDYPLHFTVLPGETVNAFALPGGEIVVYKGLLIRMNKPDQLAALLAHEASHVHYRHSLNNMADNVMWSLLLMTITGDGGLGAVLAQQGNELRSLSYSRDLETQADTAGLSILCKNNIHPKAMKELMLILKAESQGSQAVPEFVQTHPLPDSRIETIDAFISDKSNIPNSTLTSDAFIKLKSSVGK
ncbi:MAG: M48 family metallopeptidase [Bacteroidia bacterium]|jgi:Zn-dependent protease with chaperone function